MIRVGRIVNSRRHIDPMPKSFKTQPTPLVSLLIVITSVLIGTLVYQQFFSSGVIDLSGLKIWIAIAVPAGIFASVFLQTHANQRARQVAQKVHSSINQPEANRTGNDPRRTPKPSLDQSLPEKDPFENL